VLCPIRKIENPAEKKKKVFSELVNATPDLMKYTQREFDRLLKAC